MKLPHLNEVTVQLSHLLLKTSLTRWAFLALTKNRSVFICLWVDANKFLQSPQWVEAASFLGTVHAKLHIVLLIFNAATCTKCMFVALKREGVFSKGVLRYLRPQWLCKPDSTHERGWQCYTQSVLTEGRWGGREGCSISVLKKKNPFSLSHLCPCHMCSPGAARNL